MYQLLQYNFGIQIAFIAVVEFNDLGRKKFLQGPTSFEPPASAERSFPGSCPTASVVAIATSHVGEIHIAFASVAIPVIHRDNRLRKLAMIRSVNTAGIHPEIL